MALFELPAHQLEMDEPAPSEVFQYNGETMYRWIMSNTEKAHIADMLSMDGRSSFPFNFFGPATQ
ncbi:hypothetical protein K4F52_003641 [Lecanicillium sp. MT-2017a]|nr:hypothetical protein K4F52_003641 [Lecanicillium sp. MT-2017a]